MLPVIYKIKYVYYFGLLLEQLDWSSLKTLHELPVLKFAAHWNRSMCWRDKHIFCVTNAINGAERLETVLLVCYLGPLGREVFLRECHEIFNLFSDSNPSGPFANRLKFDSAVWMTIWRRTKKNFKRLRLPPPPLFILKSFSLMMDVFTH